MMEMSAQWGSQSWLPPAFSRRLDSTESAVRRHDACPTNLMPLDAQRSKSGGVYTAGAGTIKDALTHAVVNGATISSVATTAGALGAAFSAFTKLRSPCVLHWLGSALPVRASNCVFCAESNICGQEETVPPEQRHHYQRRHERIEDSPHLIYVTRLFDFTIAQPTPARAAPA